MKEIVVVAVLLFPLSAFAQWHPDCSVTRGTSCYEFVQDKVSFDVAQTACQGKGGDIITPPDVETTQFVIQSFKLRSICYQDGCRFWIQRPSTNFSFWDSGEPNNRSPNVGTIYGKACISAVYSSGLWYDDDCARERRAYICEYIDLRCSTLDLLVDNAEYAFCGQRTASLEPNGTVVPIQCHANFLLIGPPNVTCLSGIWSTSPECKRGCPQPEIPPFTTLSSPKDQYFVKDEVVLLCHSGFVVEGHPFRSHFIKTCGADGQWSNSSTKCIPIIYKQIETIAISSGETLDLDCVINGEESEEDELFIWQHDSSIITITPRVKVDDGRLHILNFSDKDAGVYSCFRTEPSFQIGEASYDVRLTEACDTSFVQSTIKQVNEGDPVLLNCPHPPLATVKWFKNNERIFQSSRKILHSDGSLVFTKFIYEDRGTYTCLIKHLDSYCTQNVTIQVSVVASLETICGKPGTPDRHPWTVSLWNEGDRTPFCYGTLFHQRHVLTSAYCISPYYRKRSFKMFAQFGKTLRDVDHLLESNSSNIMSVESLKIHPKYSRRLFANDVAILRLKGNVHFSEDIQPICVTKDDFTIRPKCEVNPLLSGTVSGWGSLERDFVDDVSLLEEPMQWFPSQQCQQTDLFKISDNIFCAVNNASEKVTFAADIGSPFEYVSNNRVYLLGIYSIGERLSHVGDYDYFTKIASYIPWIETHVKNV